MPPSSLETDKSSAQLFCPFAAFSAWLLSLCSPGRCLKGRTGIECQAQLNVFILLVPYSSNPICLGSSPMLSRRFWVLFLFHPAILIFLFLLLLRRDKLIHLSWHCNFQIYSLIRIFQVIFKPNVLSTLNFSCNLRASDLLQFIEFSSGVLC